MAVEAVFGGQVVWHSEIDKAASKVLAYRYPDVPNLGDITQINWANWKPMLKVDVLCGGFPCQDVSAAGKRAGIKDGTRSGLWAVFAEAIDALRPQWVVIENVRGLLSATANRNVESDEAVVGDGGARPVLRAIGAVVGDLADLGYVGGYTTLAASTVGAPHRRERVFVLAADTGRDGRSRGAERHLKPSAELRASQQDDADRRVLADGRDIGRADAANTAGDRWDEGRPESTRLIGRPDAAVSGDEPGVALLPTPRSSDCFGAGQHGDGGMDLRTTISLLPTPRSHRRGDCESERNRNDPDLEATTHHFPDGRWGKYAPAIARWERVTGQPAPAPTEPNKNGNPRLSAAFSEWLMGWPAGWVTDPAIGISRNDQLRIVGSGVCPQQATAALHYLLDIEAGATQNTQHARRERADVTLLPTPCARDYKDGEFPASHARNTPSLGAISAYYGEVDG